MTDELFTKKNEKVFIGRGNLFSTPDPRSWYRVPQPSLCYPNTEESSPVTEGGDMETGSGC